MPPSTGPRRDAGGRLAPPIAAIGLDLGCLLRPCHGTSLGPVFPRRRSDWRRATQQTEERRMKRVVAIILGGGAGTRLYPLTKLRAKPAVPLGAKYRLIDIPISNCINSEIHPIYVLTNSTRPHSTGIWRAPMPWPARASRKA